MTGIAPEVSAAQIRPDINFREQLDVDSMDVLRFVISLHTAYGVEIPERDYSKLATPDACVTYLDAAHQVNTPDS